MMLKTAARKFDTMLLLLSALDICEYRSTYKISELTGIGRSYIEQLCSRLMKMKVVVSRKGLGGGYTLSRPLHKTPLIDLVEFTPLPPTLELLIKITDGLTVQEILDGFKNHNISL